ncbi:hypothetical protein TGRUB_428590 [Toxoplasma gondii RUB]|uniref:Uncharacterized protein n=1 Tax=Toxoplasma gondii RUB TaxID=935652 RepID=A0A086MBU7_TOXGO|nr:hypothetical protein TGRUB_428590 [Toxoplasma gondii RUB]
MSPLFAVVSGPTRWRCTAASSAVFQIVNICQPSRIRPPCIQYRQALGRESPLVKIKIFFGTLPVDMPTAVPVPRSYACVCVKEVHGHRRRPRFQPSTEARFACLVSQDVQRSHLKVSQWEGRRGQLARVHQTSAKDIPPRSHTPPTPLDKRSSLLWPPPRMRIPELAAETSEATLDKPPSLRVCAPADM